ncbi:hypothetical protein [Streptomyces sp. NPDC058385]|uniref:hypothetical protein n=1 Tax=Streptomyces sp. NPDC058385 TaxID=3346473 RepID=UPI00364E16F8
MVSGVDVEAGRADGVELTLIRYDGSTRLLRPLGRFTVTGGDTKRTRTAGCSGV